MSTESFIYLGASPGTSKSDYAIAVPYPTEAPVETSRLVDSGRNASGAMVGRQYDVGNVKVKAARRRLQVVEKDFSPT